MHRRARRRPAAARPAVRRRRLPALAAVRPLAPVSGRVALGPGEGARRRCRARHRRRRRADPHPTRGGRSVAASGMGRRGRVRRPPRGALPGPAAPDLPEERADGRGRPGRRDVGHGPCSRGEGARAAAAQDGREDRRCERHGGRSRADRPHLRLRYARRARGGRDRRPRLSAGRGSSLPTSSGTTTTATSGGSSPSRPSRRPPESPAPGPRWARSLRTAPGT